MTNYGQILNNMDDSEIVNMVVTKIAQAGNRAERRKILKALNKTKNIEYYTSKKVNERAEEEVKERSNNSFGYIMATVGLALHDRGWDDDAISDFLQVVSERMDSEWNNGHTADDMLKLLEEKTGIELVVK